MSRRTQSLSLSLLQSAGFIEQASFSIPGRLDVTGADLTYSGEAFSLADIGQMFSLTAAISNSGLGTNFDTMTLNLMVVPEPATISLIMLWGACNGEA